MENMPHPDRRKEDGLVRTVLEIFVGRQSRKVAFGIWAFIAANALISSGKIDMAVYWKMFLVCAMLIGFGTIADSILEKLGDQLAAKVADKIKTDSGAIPS